MGLLLRKLWYEEDGIGTLEILLIIAVLVAIAIVFRKWIVSWVNSLFERSQSEMDQFDTDPLLQPNAED